MGIITNWFPVPDNQAAIEIAEKWWKSKKQKSVKIGKVTTYTYDDDEVLNAEGQHKHQGVNDGSQSTTGLFQVADEKTSYKSRKKKPSRLDPNGNNIFHYHS